MLSDSIADDNNIVTMVDQLIQARRINQHQYQALSAAVLADGTVDETERRQINRLFDAIQNGVVKIID